MVTALAGVLLAAGVAPAAESDDGEDEDGKTPATPNPADMYTPPGGAGYDETETFYFGPDEEKIWLARKIEESRYQDRSGAASRTVKKAMGWTLITVGLLSTVYAAFWHYDTHEPSDYYTGKEKYDEKGYVPLIREQTVYWPSVVAGMGLIGGGFWLMNHN